MSPVTTVSGPLHRHTKRAGKESLGPLMKTRRKMRKMHLLIDVDQVVADLHTEWIKRYNATYDDDLSIEEITDWEMHRFVKPACGYSIYNYLRMPNLYRDVRPIQGALSGVNILRDLGHRVTFVTSCVVGSMDMKARWLRDHGFLPNKRSFKDLVIAKDKNLVRGDVLVDDGPHNIESFPGFAIIMDYPWNRYVWIERERPYRRAYNWDDIILHVMDFQKRATANSV